MKRISLLACTCIALLNMAHAQNFFTKNGTISFFSKSPLENISAVNNQVVSILNTSTGDIRFSIIIKGFQFKKALMQEHFNENYMESEKFPKATFTGTIADISKVNFTKDGDYSINVSGDMMIHGVTKKISTPAFIAVKSGKFTSNATFRILLSDYNISTPKLVENNISKTIEIKVSCNYEPK